MRVHDLKPHPGARKGIKRVGRGPGSGQGKTAGRGHKGQNARSGKKGYPGFEGGQTSLSRRIPKRGFNNAMFAKKYSIVNVEDLNAFPTGTEVTPALLLQESMISRRTLVKILGNGALDNQLTVKAHKFSKSAVEKIEAAGGQVEVL